LNAAHQVAFLVAGDKKAEAIHAVLEGGADYHARPAAGVKPDDGATTWLIDEAAAKLLSNQSANS
jgi:6-phosphogluconolactonase